MKFVALFAESAVLLLLLSLPGEAPRLAEVRTREFHPYSMPVPAMFWDNGNYNPVPTTTFDGPR